MVGANGRTDPNSIRLRPRRLPSANSLIEKAGVSGRPSSRWRATDSVAHGIAQYCASGGPHRTIASLAARRRAARLHWRSGDRGNLRGARDRIHPKGGVRIEACGGRATAETSTAPERTLTAALTNEQHSHDGVDELRDTSASGQSRQRRTLAQHGPSGLRAVAGAASATSAAAGSPPRKRAPRRRRGRPGRDAERRLCDTRAKRAREQKTLSEIHPWNALLAASRAASWLVQNPATHGHPRCAWPRCRSPAAARPALRAA